MERIALEPRLWTRLAELATARGVSRTALIAQALERWVRRQP